MNLPDPATLMLTAKNDGRPGPAAQQAQARRPLQALRVRWVTYRGPARVTFDPQTAGSPDGTAATIGTKALFKVPGDYRLRAIASDGQLFSTHDIDVTVNPPPSGQTRS